MAGVLGIDAAWTAKEPSGIALLEGSPGEWRCVTVTPSYGSFLALAEGVLVDWVAKAKGAVPEASRLLAAAERLLGGGEVAVVTVDMPLATVPISGRREADSAISRVYGVGARRCTRPAPSDPASSATVFLRTSRPRGFRWLPPPRP